MNQFIVILDGPICSGKTKVAESILSNYKKVFSLSANKIKFLISDYTPNRDREVVHECLMLIAERMLQNGMSLLLEGGSVTQGKLNESLKELAHKHGLKVIVVNIEAPLDALKKRFRERVITAVERGSKLSVTDDTGYMERYAAYQAIKHEGQKTFDSSTQSSEEIAKEIMALV